jgi:hypothetical protein
MSARWVELDAISKLRARTRGPVLNSATPVLLQLVNSWPHPSPAKIARRK